MDAGVEQLKKGRGYRIILESRPQLETRATHAKRDARDLVWDKYIMSFLLEQRREFYRRKFDEGLAGETNACFLEERARQRVTFLKKCQPKCAPDGLSGKEVLTLARHQLEQRHQLLGCSLLNEAAWMPGP